MAFKMKTIPEVLGFNAEHSEQKSIVFESKLPKNVWGMVDMNGVININKNLSARQKAKAVMHPAKRSASQVRTPGRFCHSGAACQTTWLPVR